MDFIDYACKKILDKDWSPDAVVGFAKRQENWKDKPVVSTKTLYNYIDQSKFHVRNIGLPMKTKLNTKTRRIRKHRRVLGKSITERPPKVEDRLEFGHWEIETVEGEMSDDNTLLTLVERKTRNYHVININDQNDDSVDYTINKFQDVFRDFFPYVFKTIICDNSREFANSATCLKMSQKFISHHLMHLTKEALTDKHSGLLRRYVPKGKAMFDYSS